MYTLKKTNKIVLKEPSENIRRAISALRDGSFTKIICGASNTNKKHIERLAIVYSLSGANALDICPTPDIFEAAKSGVKRALEIYNQNPQKFPNFKEPVIMISIDSGDDLHFRKAEINPAKCTNCLKCINSCPSGALFSKDDLLKFNKENCYGCGRCEGACLQNAINFIKLNITDSHASASPSLRMTMWNENIKAIEVHTGNNSVEEVKKFLELNVSLLKNTELMSFCVESKRFSHNELINYVNSLIDLISQKVIIQIDGIPMGATDKPDSSLQTVSAAKVLLENNVNAYIQLSGGTNQHTRNLVNQLELKISGIGYGTFARKLILSYLEELDDSEFAMQLQRIVNITTSLVGI